LSAKKYNKGGSFYNPEERKKNYGREILHPGGRGRIFIENTRREIFGGAIIKTGR